MKNIMNSKNGLKLFKSLKISATIKGLLIALLAIQLFACTSTQTKGEISQSNWQAIGEEDGRAGIKESSLAHLKKLSNKYGGGEVDYPTYQMSYEKGLTIYCQPENAVKMSAATGESYNGVCDRFPQGDKFRQDWERTSQLK